MRTLPGLAVPALVLTLTAGAAGCPDDPCAADEPAYGGLGNDEVWLTLKDAKSGASTDGDAPTVTAPAADAALPADAAPTFTWESPLKIALGPSQNAPLYRAPRRSPVDAFVRAAWTGVGEAFIPSAHAHLPPVSSDAYLVDVLVAGRECPVSIVTTELSHELDADTWSILKDAGGPLTLQLTSAYLANGRVSEGPFKAADVTFTVE